MAFVNNVFKHILSIGYEFETHDISKMSMVENDFIVSDTTNPGLKEKLKKGEATPLDNHSFLIPYREYINEPDMDGDVPNHDIMMHLTVDFNEDNFDTQLAHCDNSSDKNSLYGFKLHRTLHPIRFAKDLESSSCTNFSGVEWIVTYYKPPSSAHIILNTYLDACSRIIGQLNSFEKETGKFIIRETKEVVGYKNRHLYHKPGTNLYLLQRNDGIDTKTFRNTFSLDSIEVIPQMTFCVNASHAMDVMQAMLTFQPTKNTRIGMNLKKLQEEFSLVYECAAELVSNKKAICYLGLILFKAVVYVNRYSLRSEDSGYYFKDDLTFAVRHSNVLLYQRLKEWVDVSTLQWPERLYRYKSALTKQLDPSHKDFGNPKVSLPSYFAYLEKGTDWFEDKDIVKYVSTFELKDDNLIIEHREFGPTIATMMTDRNIHVKQFAPTIRMIQTLNDSLLEEKQAKNINGKIYNRLTSRYTKKCRPGQHRDASFSCKKRI
jgi:hypothetical protein